MTIDTDVERASEVPYALARLMRVAEGNGFHARTVANFLFATLGEGSPLFDLTEIGRLNEEIGDDILLCLCTMRFRHSLIYEQAFHVMPDDKERLRRIMSRFYFPI